jgi:hypothetical protein
MASNTASGGASYTEHELNDPDAPEEIRITRQQLGKVDQCPGGSSTPSSSSAETSDDSSTVNPREPAPTTESHSPVSQPAVDSSADLTAGDGPKTESPQSAKKQQTKRTTVPRKANTNTNAASTRIIDDDDF